MKVDAKIDTAGYEKCASLEEWVKRDPREVMKKANMIYIYNGTCEGRGIMTAR